MAEYNMSHMVRPQGFSLEELRQTMSRSAIREQCYFIYATGNILEIISGFDELLNQEGIQFGADKLAAVYVCGLMVYLLHHEDTSATQVKRTLFLQKCFNYMACSEESHIHQVCVHVLGLLDIQSSSTMLNLILGCRVASPLCTMASVVANCLLWAMLDHMSDLGLDLHRLRPANTLLLVVAVVKPHIYVISYLHSLHLVVRLISSILLIGPFNAQGQQLCQETDVPEDYMKLARDDCSILVRWLIAIVDELRPLMVENNDLGHLHERLVLLESICELMQLLHGHLVKCYQGKSGPQCK
uniref:LP16520p n=1 Tax=Drosophila melanogaster TaxID=7227 RepID=Q9VYK9_DROME|eukprot:NP_001245643.1 uncharacterized protein Dmel_CG15728, isoform B [Drosophila melanogaster]